MSTKIFLIIFVLALIPAIILGKSVFEGIIFASNTLSFNFSTEGISIRSSGECTPVRVGPKEIMSNVGYLSRNRPRRTG